MFNQVMGMSGGFDANMLLQSHLMQVSSTTLSSKQATSCSTNHVLYNFDCAGSERDASYAEHARSSPVPQPFKALCFFSISCCGRRCWILHISTHAALGEKTALRSLLWCRHAVWSKHGHGHDEPRDDGHDATT